MSLQRERLNYKPVSPSTLDSKNETYYLEIQDLPPLSGPLARQFPLLAPVRPSLIKPCSRQSYDSKKKLNVSQYHFITKSLKLILQKTQKVGVVLSGGPAPGGHNVISGLYHYLKVHHPGSQLFGFLGLLL